MAIEPMSTLISALAFVVPSAEVTFAPGTHGTSLETSDTMPHA